MGLKPERKTPGGKVIFYPIYLLDKPFLVKSLIVNDGCEFETSSAAAGFGLRLYIS